MPTRPTYHLQTFTRRPHPLPAIHSAITRSGGWVLETVSSQTTLHLQLEIQLGAMVQLFAALLSADLELSPDAYITLLGLCTCRHHIARSPCSGRVVPLALEVTLLDHVCDDSQAPTRSPLIC